MELQSKLLLVELMFAVHVRVLKPSQAPQLQLVEDVVVKASKQLSKVLSLCSKSVEIVMVKVL
jgi:hypothetical protein